MARPIKTNADYFTHDNDMRNHRKVKALRTKYSFKGYAIWCFMLEVLTDSKHFECDWDELNIELLAGDFLCDPDELQEIINYCIKIKLLELHDFKLSSPKLKKRFEPLLSKRKRDRKEVIADDNEVTDVDNEVIADESTQSKVKESKVKEIREDYVSFLEKNKDSIFEIFYFRNLKNPLQELDRFTSHYLKTGGTDGNGNPVRDFRAAARLWNVSSTGQRIPQKMLEKWSKVYSSFRHINGENCLDESQIPLVLKMSPRALKDGILEVFVQTRDVVTLREQGGFDNFLRAVGEIFGNVRVYFPPR